MVPGNLILPLLHVTPFPLSSILVIPISPIYFFFLSNPEAFHGVFEPIGTIGIPLLVTLLLVFLPFYDSGPERNPARRTPAMVCYAIFVTWVITMAIIGYYSHPRDCFRSEFSEIAGVSGKLDPDLTKAGRQMARRIRRGV
jgi:quinol-cytochrome oxidoreductase complex cytochrome b subunit